MKFGQVSFEEMYEIVILYDSWVSQTMTLISFTHKSS